jgi:hypothetical protein
VPGRLRDPGPLTDPLLSGALRPAATSSETSRYEEWTVAQLRLVAAEVGIAGRSTMRKSELVAALRGR